MPELLDTCYEQVLGFAAQGRLKFRPATTFPLQEWCRAAETVQSRRMSGRVLLLP